MRASCIVMVLALCGAACGGAPRGGAAVPAEATAAAGGSAGAPITPTEGAQNAPAVAVEPVAAVDASATGGGGAGGTEDIVSVRPGFRPDPIVRTGRVEGTREAMELDESCRGYITDAPSHVLKVDATVPGLRVLAAMRGDATLVVQLADGTMLCNDDSEGLNPILTGPFPPGRHRVWVGTYSAPPPGGVAYAIAFTTDPTLSTSSLDGARGTP